MLKTIQLLLPVLVLGLIIPAKADSQPPYIEWKQWRVGANENWNYDVGPKPKFPLRHPFTNLFDDDSRTTWVYSDVWPEAKDRTFSGDKYRALHLIPKQSVTIDGLWLMNGENKSADLYRRNDRIFRIEILLNEQKVKVVNLPDKMGWHKITFPRQSVRDIQIIFTGIRKGAGPNNAVGISEMAFFNRGQKLDMQMPPAVIYQVPICCGTFYEYLVARNGKVLAKSGSGEGYSVQWNPKNQLIAGVDDESKNAQLLVADTKRQRVIFRRHLNRDFLSRLVWHGPRKIEVVYYDPHKHRDGVKRIFEIK